MLKRPPSANEIIYLPVLDPASELRPVGHAWYSKLPEKVYALFAPSRTKLVTGG